MRKLALVVLAFGFVAMTAQAGTDDGNRADYFPLKAAPEFHKPLFENDSVLVLDVSIPAGATVPAHVHPWPAVFITLQPAHLVFRNLAAEVVREVRPPAEPLAGPKVEWREPDAEPSIVTNVDSTAMHALRVELKFLARPAPPSR